MSFRTNPSQQLTIEDSTLGLTPRELRALEGSWAKVFGDEVFPAIDEARFRCLYSGVDSRPNTPANVIVGALVIKELFGYTDDELVEALMFDVRLQYALHTTSFAEQPLSDKTLSRFRRRCYDHEEETGEDLWRDCVRDLAAKTAKIMRIDGRVRRMDSMMIESNIRTLSRSEIVYECLANACRALSRVLGDQMPEALSAYADRDNFNRVFYHDRDKTLEERLARVFEDAEALVGSHAADLAGTEELALLLRVLVEQTVVEDGTRRLRDRKDGMRGSSMLQSPYDADATFRKKAGRDHRGYSANLEESCGEAGTVVTNYDYRPNNHSDGAFLREFVEEADEVEGAVLVTDGGYDGAGNLDAAESRGIELVTTDLVGKDPVDCYADFEWAEDGRELLSCAAGHKPLGCSYVETTGQVRATFDASVCEACPLRGECRSKVGKTRAAVTCSKNSTRRARHRRRMGSGDFERYSRLRNGAETVPSILRRWYRLDFLPRGRIGGKLFFGAKVAALNFRKLLGFMRRTGNYAANPLLA